MDVEVVYRRSIKCRGYLESNNVNRLLWRAKWKRRERKWWWPISRYYLKVCLEGFRNTTKHLNQPSRFQSRDSKQVHTDKDCITEVPV